MYSGTNKQIMCLRLRCRCGRTVCGCGAGVVCMCGGSFMCIYLAFCTGLSQTIPPRRKAKGRHWQAPASPWSTHLPRVQRHQSTRPAHALARRPWLHRSQITRRRSAGPEGRPGMHLISSWPHPATTRPGQTQGPRPRRCYPATLDPPRPAPP